MPHQGGIDDMLGSLDLDIGLRSPKRDTREQHVTMEEDNPLNFESVLAESKSTTKQPFFETETSKIDTAQAIEVDNRGSDTILTESTDPGTSVLKDSTSYSISEKLYCLYITPVGDSLSEICRTYIGQGSSLCVVKNCTKNHRKTEKMGIEEGQLFISKTKDTIFF